MILTVLMVIIMTLSNVLNNNATTIVAAPIAIQMAQSLNMLPDPFLMADAVAASSAFLTPISYKNNMLTLGSGRYLFGVNWRMGLPLEILIVAVSVPAILFILASVIRRETKQFLVQQLKPETDASDYKYCARGRSH